MIKNVPICLLILSLLHSCSWSCPAPATLTSPTTNTTMDTPMSPQNKHGLIRRYDVEINSFCKGDGSTSVHSNWHTLQIGAHSNYAQGCGQQYTRYLLAFKEIDLLPLNATVKSAQMKLFGTMPGNFEPYSYTEEHIVINEILIKRILTKWNANTVTWETQPNTTDTNAAVIPSTKPTLPVVAMNTELYNFTIDITQLVRDIQASGPGNNYGFMLQMKHERPYRFMIFCSFDHPDIQQHPQITIET